MSSSSGRIFTKRLAEALSARHFSVSRVSSKGKHIPPPPAPAYGPGSNPASGTTPVKPSGSPATLAPAKSAPNPPAGSGGVPSTAPKQGGPPPSPSTTEPAALQQGKGPSVPSQPAPSVLQPRSSGPAGKDPANVPASAKPTQPAPVTPAPSPPKPAPAAVKEQPRQPTASPAPAAPPQQPIPAAEIQATQPPGAQAVKITGPAPPPAASAGGVGQDRAKQAYFTGGTAARSSGDHRKPPQGNAWLISKSLPVDVRLLAAGAASIGALYFYTSQEKQPNQDTAPSQGGGDDGGVPSATFSGEAEGSGTEEETLEAGGAPADEFQEVSNGGEELPSATGGTTPDFGAGDFYTDELAMQSKGATDEGHKEEPALAAQAEEPKPVALPPPEPSILKKEEIISAAKTVENSIQNGQPLEMVDTKPVTDLLDEVGTGSWQLLEAPGAGGQVSAAYADVEELKGATTEPGKLSVEKSIDGTDNISADALLKRAVERAESEGRDWAMKHENLVQARADEQTFREVLEKARATQQAKLAAAMEVAEANAQRAEEIQAAADAAQERFAQILEDTVRLSNVQRDQELLRQAGFLTTAAAEAAVRERSERAGTLDELRGKVNALGQAFSQRSDEQRDSTRAHQVSLGAFALEDALAHGRPYAAAASLLSQSCSEDDLVAAALQALPTDSAEKGIPTRVELLQRAPGVAQNARQMAYIQPGSGGIISLGLARLAASMKVPEGSARPGEGTDGALASMQAHLAAGRLAEAADALEAGTKDTAAEKAASEWARDARARALADQTTALLQAHACSLAVSQS